MIVMASDYVGWKVMEYLTGRGEDIRYLIIDPHDRGGYNSRITDVYKARVANGTVLTGDALADRGVIDELSNSNPKIGILAWWPNILKGPILKVPAMGWLNFHPSYLPFNRGKHPNFWCLVDETPCGVTLHYVNEGIDSGGIVAQKKTELSWEDTGETVYLKARESMIELLQEKYDDIIAGRLPVIEQALEAGTFHRAKEIETACRIDLDATMQTRRLLNILRAKMFRPHAPAFFQDGDKTYSVEIVIKEVATP